VDANVSGFDDATSAGVLAGYDVYSKDVIAVSLEAEFTTTVSDGDVKIQGFRGDWDIDTQAAYLAVRGGDRAYIKVRIGVVHNDVTVRVAGFRENERLAGCSLITGACNLTVLQWIPMRLTGTLG